MSNGNSTTVSSAEPPRLETPQNVAQRSKRNKPLPPEDIMPVSKGDAIDVLKTEQGISDFVKVSFDAASGNPVLAERMKLESKQRNANAERPAGANLPGSDISGAIKEGTDAGQCRSCDVSPHSSAAIVGKTSEEAFKRYPWSIPFTKWIPPGEIDFSRWIGIQFGLVLTAVSSLFWLVD